MRICFSLIVRAAIGMAVLGLVFLSAEIVLACGNCGCCRNESSTALGGGAAIGDVVISEIMYNADGDDVGREWVEIYNTGASAVDLAGWQLGDSQDNQWTAPFPAGTSLAPGQALVVTGDSASFLSQWRNANHIEVAGFPTLANDPSTTNEVLALRDIVGLLHDFVNYDDAFDWPRVNGSQGQSIFVLPSGLSDSGNNLGVNWKPSMWGAYGARYVSSGGENQASPGTVETMVQAPFEPSPDAIWSMVLLPDTQNYSKSSADKHIFTRMTEWIRDNRDAFKIQAVLHEGDIVNHNRSGPTSGNLASAEQWQNAQTSMHVLNGHVPYILAAGNHDFGTTNAQDRQTFINDYFKPSDNPLTDPAQGGILKGTMVPGEIQNAYYEFTAPDGRRMLILALEWEPRPATVAWANEVVARPEYEEHTAVLLTHAYLLADNSRYSNSRVPADYSGQELWDGLVRLRDNFEMTVNGHFGGDGTGYLASTGVGGNTVHQMFLNTQFETYGGDGWLRVVEFLDDGTTVRVRTYSPFHDMQRVHPQFAFEFQISPLPLPPLLVGDYNDDGIVDSRDYTVWRDSLGSMVNLDADGDGSGTVDQADYDLWKQNFGETQAGLGQLTASVPEPSTWFAALLAASILACLRKRSEDLTPRR